MRHNIADGIVRMMMTQLFIIIGHLFDILLTFGYGGREPDADVCSNQVHETKLNKSFVYVNDNLQLF